MQAKTKKIVTLCPLCYYNFKKNSEDLEIIDFSELICKKK